RLALSPARPGAQRARLAAVPVKGLVLALPPGIAPEAVHLHLVLPSLPQESGDAGRRQGDGLPGRRRVARQADPVGRARGGGAGRTGGAHARPIEDEDRAHHPRPPAADEPAALAAAAWCQATGTTGPPTARGVSRMSIVPSVLPLPSDQDASGRTL